jgi:sulfate transporter 4
LFEDRLTCADELRWGCEQERLNKYELRAEEEAEMQGSKVRFVIIDMSPVSHIDASAVHALVDINAAYRKRDVQLVLSNPAKQVQAMMTR